MKKYLNNKKISSIIIDLDGTLYPRVIYQRAYYEFTLNSLCYQFNKSETEARKILSDNLISPNSEDKQGSVSSLINKLGMNTKDWNKYRDKHFDISQKISKDKDLVDLLHRIKVNYKVCLLTNNTNISTYRILDKIGIPQSCFISVITSDNSQYLKPNQNSFKHLVNSTGMETNETISVGDRFDVDIEPFIAIGGSGLLVDTPSDLFLLEKILKEYA